MTILTDETVDRQSRTHLEMTLDLENGDSSLHSSADHYKPLSVK